MPRLNTSRKVIATLNRPCCRRPRLTHLAIATILLLGLLMTRHNYKRSPRCGADVAIASHRRQLDGSKLRNDKHWIITLNYAFARSENSNRTAFRDVLKFFNGRVITGGGRPPSPLLTC
ncbi:hypothetical protein EVAR_97898_1 [Eumeta japonica]|uniref:Uncharacterized protein n=1 Tax=Eumeta variegata TaxID=151549 RepID=A0A4C1WEP7_EUMVA|nr:hypothetical protein EVAR_97898_1 [Eumeta japonica]